MKKLLIATLFLTLACTEKQQSSPPAEDSSPETIYNLDTINGISYLVGGIDQEIINLNQVESGKRISLVVSIKNVSSAPTAVITPSISSSYYITSSTCASKSLAPQASCSLTINFSSVGKSLGMSPGTLTYGSSSIPITVTVVSAITVAPAQLILLDSNNQAQTSPVDLGSFNLSKGTVSKTLIFKNIGATASAASSLSLQNNNSGWYVVSNSCVNKILSPQSTCSFSLRFSFNARTPGSYGVDLSLDGTSYSVVIQKQGSTPPAGALSSFLLGTTYGSNSYFYNPNTSKLYLWGNNSNYGNVGNNSGVEELSPVNISNSGGLSGKAIKQFSMYDTHSCALTTDNNIYCWGYNYAGQVGDGTAGYPTDYLKTVPTAVNMAPFGGRTIRTISTGEYFTCAVTTDDKIYCWGANGTGQSGSTDPNVDPYIQSLPNPTAVDQTGVLAGKGIKEINTSYSHACVIASDDKVYCWGSGSLLGDGTGNSSHVPVAVDWTGVLAGKTAKSISMTYSNVCIIASDDKLYCWGGNYYGILGLDDAGATSSSNVPVAVNMNGALAGKTIKSFSMSDSIACAVASDDLPYCWGFNGPGSVGNGTSDYIIYAPQAVDLSGALAGKTIKKIHTAKLSGTSVCAIASDDKLYCWGNNYSGQLANGTTDNSNVPSLSSHGLPSGLTVKNATVEGNVVCIQGSDDQVYCVGANGYGQLGSGTTDSSSSFILAPTN